MEKGFPRVKFEIDPTNKKIRFWKEIKQPEYLKHFTLSDELKKDISLLISKCKNSP